METIHVSYPDGHEHPILFDGLASVPAHLEAVGLAPGQALVVTDSNVADLMLSPLLDALMQAGWQAQSHTVEPGESSKSMAALAELYDFALQRAIDRKTPLIALGGGVIGDLAGFGAATLLRGIPLVHVPTTLVSQVDSSIGGKTGINHPTGKNLVGAFYQPKLVVTDTQRLQTLPDREWTSGLGEVVKHGLIDGPEHVRRLIQVWPDLLNRDGERLDELVCRSARVKVGVVTQDQRETGLRSLLNFGHTVGHGIERAAGYGQVSHGEAVAAGMAVALFGQEIRAGRKKAPSRDQTTP